jgi:NAD(P)-dependent dehydrogenase (short-subunit alcohol dehydrogenase family)
MEAKEKVWLITGASKGLGLALAQKVLAQGGRIVATSRKKEELVAALGASDSQFLPLEMQLTDEQSVQAGIEQAVQTFGQIDVVVNNAGYGQIGTLEELSDAEARQNFDVNVFGLLNVIRHAMPHLRKQGRGHIFNIASIGGYIGNFPGWGIYCATKFAVVGLTESLAAESKSFGIHATVVYPGYFRTNFLSKDSVKVPVRPIEAYAEARASQEQHQHQINGNQPNDPEKAAEALIRIAGEENPPVHLFLGPDAYEMVGVKNDIVKQELATWKELTLSTVFTNQAVADA